MNIWIRAIQVGQVIIGWYNYFNLFIFISEKQNFYLSILIISV